MAKQYERRVDHPAGRALWALGLGAVIAAIKLGLATVCMLIWLVYAVISGDLDRRFNPVGSGADVAPVKVGTR